MENWYIFLIVVCVFLVTFIILRLKMYFKLCSYRQKHFNKNNTGSVHIPKKIFQLYFNSNEMHPSIKKNIEYIKKLNPEWTYILYDKEQDMVQYIKKHYSPYILNIYNKINPEYGAAKADFFRYLLMYKEGGVYLDSKSGMEYPLNKIIKEDDEYILSHWLFGKPFKETINNEFGEFQQWHIICKPNHLFLKAVIDNVIKNIENYDINKDGVGNGVLLLTGPVVYSKSIIPLLSSNKHRICKMNEYIGLIYNNVSYNFFGHRKTLGKTHYSKLKTPIIK